MRHRAATLQSLRRAGKNTFDPDREQAPSSTTYSRSAVSPRKTIRESGKDRAALRSIIAVLHGRWETAGLRGTCWPG